MTAQPPADDRSGDAAVASSVATLAPNPSGSAAIELREVRLHNLKGIDVDIPLGKLTVVTGVSGSGKSSLAFDTLYAEGQRRYIETFAPAARQHLETLAKPDAESIGQIPPAIALRQNSVSRTRQATVATVTEINDFLRALLSRCGTIVCPSCQCEVVPQSPESVTRRLDNLTDGLKFQLAFPITLEAEIDTSEQLRWLATSGYGRLIKIGDHSEQAAGGPSHQGVACSIEDVMDTGAADSPTELLVIVDRLVAGRSATERLTESVEACFRDGDGHCVLLRPATSPNEVNSSSQAINLDGQDWRIERFSQRGDCMGCRSRFPEADAALLSFRSPHGACPQCTGTGIDDGLRCPVCDGSRLSLNARAVRLRPASNNPPVSSQTAVSTTEWPGLAELEGRTVDALLQTLVEITAQTENLPPEPATQHLFDSLLPRLQSLSEAGLGHIELNRAMCDMSRGEAQRVALASIFSSQLVNSLFVLDEPSSGLHPADLSRVCKLLHRLRDQGNTVVVVEHELDLARSADHVNEIGPGSGSAGGNVVFAGHFDDLLEVSDSATAGYFRAESPEPQRESATTDASKCTSTISLTGCRHHTLQNLSVDFPLGCLCVVTGVSGSGKTSLVEQTLYPAVRRHLDTSFAANSTAPEKRDSQSQDCGEFDQLTIDGPLSGVELVDDRPLVASRRSSPVTWLKILGEIRTLFADTPDARNRNLTTAHFTFNTDAGGRCPKCAGTGFIEIDMQFMADVTMTCPDCHGTRFLPHILEVTWRNRSIADVLAMTADEAFAFFRGERRIQKKLVALRDVGLGYLPLGQPLSTLSGGESQRLKLAGHLASTKGASNLLILNEPTTGLHPLDVQNLLECFRRLLTAGHSLIVIEHHRDVILAADHVIDLGPGAGPSGGRVIAAGTPDKIQHVQDSETGAWLRRAFESA